MLTREYHLVLARVDLTGTRMTKNKKRYGPTQTF